MFFLPVILLAVRSAVECRFASRAYFVLAEVTLWRTAEVAFLDEILVLSALFCLLGILVKLHQMLKPLLWGVVVPGIDEIDLISTKALGR